MVKSMNKLDFDLLSNDLGGFGRFQMFTFCLTALCAFTGGVMISVPVFSSQTPSHRCKVPECDTETSNYSEDFLNFTTPSDPNLGTWSHCKKYDLIDSPNSTCSELYFSHNQTSSCDEWIYDTELFKKTTVTQFNLVCTKSRLVSFESGCYMAGNLVGSLFIGLFCDKYGRKLGILFSTTFLTFGAVAAAFCTHYILFLTLKFISGFGGIGCFQVSFVIALELVGKKYRSSCGLFTCTAFSLGECFTGLLAYLIRDWRYIQLAAVSPALILFTYYWVMPESIRWLATKKRDEEALEVISRAARMNKLPIPKYLCEESEETEVTAKPEKETDKSFKDLLKSKVTCRRTLILFYLWIVCTMAFYGLSLFTSNLTNNIFTNFTAVILAEIPAIMASVLLIDRVGRKGWQLSMYILAGVSCISIPFLHNDNGPVILILSLIGKFGTSAAFGSIYLWTGELYPTEYRAFGVGACSMAGRVGAVAAPFINSLKSIYYPLPVFIFGLLSLIGGLLALLLPETNGFRLPQTLEESEQFGCDQDLCYFQCGRKPEREKF